MSTKPTHVIVFHGTTSAFDASILEHGFLTNPERRPSHQVNADQKHLSAFDGTYAALNRDTARYYATAAAEENGGEPRIYVLRVPLDVMVPDEDEVHFALTWNLAHELGFDENSDEEVQLATVPWSIDVAKRAVTAISPCFGMDARQIELAAAHLNAMIEPVVQVWDGDVYFFHPDGNDVGWASPNWVRKLISLDGGYEIYRGHMDHFVRCMKGASPEDCPAGFEAFKGRIVEPFGFNGGQVEIMGCGTIADPFECYSNFDAYTGDEWSLDPDFINEVRYSRQMRALAG